MQNDRKKWLSLLAKAPSDQLTRQWHACGLAPDYQILRAPEIGGVMTRGRMGSTGAAFNLGEITVTRCSVRLATGEVGHGYVQGCDKPKAELAAVIDAAMQTADAARIQADVLSPIEAGMAGRRQTRARKAAATRVDFFTMVRGED